MSPRRVKDKLDVKIVQMTCKEVDIAIEWANKEGWNPGVHDAECFYQADPTGFYAAKLNGEVIGTISLVKYPGDFAFEGLYIIKPEFRGKGIGKIIQEFGLEITKKMTLGLDGVFDMKEKYAKYGLKYCYHSTRYAGTAQNNPAKQCQTITKKDFKEVAVFDKECFGFERTSFLNRWLLQKDHTSMLIRNQKNELCGFGVIRKCVKGYKIGPLFADSKAEAELLFNSLTATVTGEIVFLDVPDPNKAGVEFAEKRVLQPMFSTVRMYTKVGIELPLSKIFGVTTFELG
jgi:GNAT superfamily N-acetyltransferase